MNTISDFITVNHVRDMAATTKDEALVELCSLVADCPDVSDPEDFLNAIRGRETIMSTGIGTGIALPHAKTNSVTNFVIAVGRCKRGIDFESLDGLPVHVIILMGAPEKKHTEFLKLIAAVGAIFIEPGFIDRFFEAESPREMYELLVKNDT